MVVIGLVTGERVTIQGQPVGEIVQKLRADAPSFVEFALPTGRVFINPAHVVRVTEN